jgi:hypothetical protein
MFQVFEPIVVGVGYGAPELQTICDQLGLRAHRMSYYAVRAAALGPVSAEVVSALFYHHTMALVSPAIPLAWSIASPERIVAARFEAVDGALRRLLPQHIASAEMAEAAALARKALAGCSVAGRAMFAAHVALPWPTEPHVALWHGLNLMREHRGDGHISASLVARLDPCQSTVMLIASAGEDRAGRRARWSDDVWNQAVAVLQARGWLNDDGLPTTEGLAARTRLEDETDALALEPWLYLGEERTHRLWTLLRDFVQVIINQNAARLRTPLGLSWPAQWPGE